MRYAACALALALVLETVPAAAQEIVYESAPVVTYYAPSVPVTTYYYSSAVPVTTYYAPLTTYYPTYYSTYYAPTAWTSYYYPATYYYVPPRVARRWYRGYYW
jgi:hypothetical protein